LTLVGDRSVLEGAKFGTALEGAKFGTALEGAKFGTAGGSVEGGLPLVLRLMWESFLRCQ
jgi:hypothetical protein